MTEGYRYGGAHLLIAFLAGAATGAAVTLLSAPQSGKDTRDLLGTFARDAQARGTRLPHAVRVAAERATRAARDAFNEALKEEEGSEVEVS